MSTVKIVISHNVEEQDLASAWKTLLEKISFNMIEVWFSSDTNPLGGMSVGRDWREELYEKLQVCQFVLAIQTPLSLAKPWIMWECGVASGVGKERGIIPVIYEMERGYLPNPLNVYQEYRGDNAQQVHELCVRLLHETRLPSQEKMYKRPIDMYMKAVTLHRSRKSVRPQDITLWVNRLEELVQAGRISELNSRRQQLYSSLGKPPLDAQLHDLLSRLLLSHRNYKATIEETNYALQLSPNDIALLHRKALALVGLYNFDEAKNLIQQIMQQDSSLSDDTELATLLGRIHREQWQISKDVADLHAAFDAYYRAYKADPTSYYAGINAAELAFLQGNETQGRELIGEVLALCRDEQSHRNVSYWVDFTVGASYLALGDEQQALTAYKQGMMREPRPEAFERESAMKGAMRMANVRHLSPEITDNIRAILA